MAWSLPTALGALAGVLLLGCRDSDSTLKKQHDVDALLWQSRACTSALEVLRQERNGSTQLARNLENQRTVTADNAAHADAQRPDAAAVQEKQPSLERMTAELSEAKAKVAALDDAIASKQRECDAIAARIKAPK